MRLQLLEEKGNLSSWLIEFDDGSVGRIHARNNKVISGFVCGRQDNWARELSKREIMEINRRLITVNS